MEHFKSFKLLENWVQGKKLTDIFGCVNFYFLNFCINY